MQRGPMRALRALVCRLLLAACGVSSSESAPAPGEERLGTQESELCVGLNVTTLTLAGISSHEGVVAGAGEWAVSTGASAVRLEYFLDGALHTVDERVGTSGTWNFSGQLTCGTHTFQVKAYPMVVDSNGNRTTCYASSRSIDKNVPQFCRALSVGDHHSVKLKEDGTLWTWGSNAQGQLGDGTTTNRVTPGQVTGLANVTALSATYFHSVVVKRDGTVWAWGDNDYGQLGDGTTVHRTTPVQVTGLVNPIALAAGGDHTVTLKPDSTVWAWGANGAGQLGDGTLTHRSMPVLATGLMP